MSIANYAEIKLLDHCLGGSAFTQPSGIYVKLHTGDPGEDCTSNAATETTRKVVTFAAAASGSKASNSSVSWTSYPANETITHVSLWDASTSGNPLWSGSLSSSVAVSSGGTFTISSGQLTCTLD
jgi:hypothetical protein